MEVMQRELLKFSKEMKRMGGTKSRGGVQGLLEDEIGHESKGERWRGMQTADSPTSKTTRGCDVYGRTLLSLMTQSSKLQSGLMPMMEPSDQISSSDRCFADWCSNSEFGRAVGNWESKWPSICSLSYKSFYRPFLEVVSWRLDNWREVHMAVFFRRSWWEQKVAAPSWYSRLQIGKGVSDSCLSWGVPLKIMHAAYYYRFESSLFSLSQKRSYNLCVISMLQNV
eukprot:c24841_g2_i1 orf=471-1145(-)